MTKKQTDIGRREFLRDVLVTGGAVAVVAATGQAVAAPSVAKTQPATEKVESKGYHVTEHIREYYRLAGL